MPSLKMKTKSVTGCIREKNGLRVSQTSMISKNSLAHVRISQQADLETCTQSKQDVSFCNKAYHEEVGHNEANCYGLLDGENFQIQRQPSLSNDMETDLRIILGPVLAPCVSSLETFFSPTLQFIDDHNEPNVLSVGGSEEDREVSPPRFDDNEENDRSSCEYHTCNVSDFYISDMIFSELPIKGHCVYEFNETAPFPDYKCDEPSICLDEVVMTLPLLEDTLETSNAHDSRLCEDNNINSVDSSLYVSLHQLKSYDQESDVNTYQVSDQAECLDLDFFIRTLTDISDVATNPWPTNVMPEGTWKKKSTTLVLDLDETLVHSTLDPCDDADFTFPVFVNMKEHTVYVKQRPYLHTFLERVADMFEIVVFTASQSIYAKQLLDILDPDQKIISRRAYRESCIFADGSYTKDLTVLGVDLAKIAIIDNSPQVFRLQVNNGIPIKSWFDDPSDSALISLLPFLETLVDAEDVRPIIAKKFGHVEIYKGIATILVVGATAIIVDIVVAVAPGTAAVVTDVLVDFADVHFLSIDRIAAAVSDVLALPIEYTAPADLVAAAAIVAVAAFGRVDTAVDLLDVVVEAVVTAEGSAGFRTSAAVADYIVAVVQAAAATDRVVAVAAENMGAAFVASAADTVVAKAAAAAGNDIATSDCMLGCSE